MNIEDVAEWIKIADNDFDSAKLLNESIRKHYEIICYHCAKVVEKIRKLTPISNLINIVNNENNNEENSIVKKPYGI